MQARCQVCGAVEADWLVRQFEINVGKLQNYKVQSCDKCRDAVERAIVTALDACRPVVDTQKG